jgi:hypothetical protein
MKMKLHVIVLFLILNYSELISQNLPPEYVISYDGRRLSRGAAPVEGLYNDKVVKRIDLDFNQTNWQFILSQNYNSKTDFPATLTVDGKTYPNVGVRYKGQTSYTRVTTDKKSFNVTMDYLDPEQKLDGYETLNLNNSYEDHSYMREVFYENITRKYGPSLKAAFVNLYINGVNWGLYPHIQGLDGEYIKEWFLSNDGTRWRCERAPGPVIPGEEGAGFGAGKSTLNYLGEDTSLYKPHYMLKRTELPNPWSDLVRVARVLNTSTQVDSLNKVLDVDRSLWFLAKEILFGDDDSYVNKGGMDYFAYYDAETGRLTPLEYDANTIMHNTASTWNIFLKENNTLYPLCNKLFKIPELRQRYLAHVRTMANDIFNEANFMPLINKYYSLIDTLVQKDSKKLMTYSQFVKGKADLVAWMNNRREFILNNTEVNRIGVSISNTEYRTDAVAFKTPLAGQQVSVRTTVTGVKKPKAVYLHYGTGFDGRYARLTMADDGLHEDVQAGDGIFGAGIPGHHAGVYVRYYIEAIADDNFNTATFEPQGAEHDVYIYRVGLVNSQVNDIVINEVMSANTKTVADQDNEFDDWIELYNKSNAPVNLTRWILTDNPDNLDKYRIPQGTVIPANGYLIVWADENGKQAGLHANFKLSAAGEPLMMLDSSGNQVDMVEIPALSDDIAYARQPNGSGGFVIKVPTFNKNNDGTTPVEETGIKTGLKIYPNPAHTLLTIEVDGARAQPVRIFNAAGQNIFDRTLLREEIDITLWPAGVYLVKSGTEIRKLVIP